MRVTTYRGKSASTADFIALASQVAGYDLTKFLTEWFYGTATPPMPGHADWTVTPLTADADLSALAAPDLLVPDGELGLFRR